MQTLNDNQQQQSDPQSTSLKRSDFFYDLPQHLIAQVPVEPRDSSKLLYYDKHKQCVLDKNFFNLPDLLKSGDLLVLNDTKVIPARLFGIKQDSGAKVEFLLHKRINLTDWEIICRPAKRLKKGTKIRFLDNFHAEILSELEDGARVVRFFFNGVFEQVLSTVGQMPLPPYIKKSLSDKERYQTVYSKSYGSSAAPTAGLHFTSALLNKLSQNGIQTANVTLNVGLGTFLPVKEQLIKNHKMHSESFFVSQQDAAVINTAKMQGRRVIAVGTTSVRVLESLADDEGFIKPCSKETDIFIFPPYKFKAVDGLITNFHLPESTLIMLVSAFCGKEQTLSLYDYAIKNDYRFFSFGDAMLIL